MKQFALKLLLFIGIFFSANICIGLILRIPKNNLIKENKYHPAQQWQDFYSQHPKSIDLFFFGSSHAYRGFNPIVFDSILNIASFNMGGSCQTPTTAFFVLKEVLSTQAPKMIIYELEWLNFDIKDQYVNALYNIDFMRVLRIRCDFLWQGFSIKDKLMVLLPAFRYRNNIYDLFLKPIVKKIKKSSFLDKSTDNYIGKGYIQRNDTIPFEQLKHSRYSTIYAPPDFDVVSTRKHFNRNVFFLNRFIALCKSKNIKLIFVASPLPPTVLNHFNDYKKGYHFINSIGESNGVDYIDYNFIQDKIKFTDTDFYDDNHLNSGGSLKFSIDLAKKIAPLLRKLP
jgi:hypothetical protein